MLIDALLRAARILQTTPGYSMPLARLHTRLVHELGPEAGNYGEIYQQLKKRTDAFIVVDAARVLDGADVWPYLVREAYDAALEHAGYGSCVQVTLTSVADGEPSCELLAALGVTLATLTECAAGDAAMAAYVDSAAQQLVDLNRIVLSGETDRPTTPLPGLPPST